MVMLFNINIVTDHFQIEFIQINSIHETQIDVKSTFYGSTNSNTNS